MSSGAEGKAVRGTTANTRTWILEDCPAASGTTTAFLLILLLIRFLGSEELLPDQRLQDERRRAFLELQLFVMKGLGIGATFGGSLPEQHNAVIVSQRQRALKEQDDRRMSRFIKLNYKF